MNKFDQLSGLSEYDENLGFLKKLKKAVKKNVKKVAKVAVKPVKVSTKVLAPVTAISTIKHAAIIPSSIGVKPLKSVAKTAVNVNKTVAKAIVTDPLKKVGSKLSPIAARPEVKALAIGTATAVGAGPIIMGGITVGSMAAQLNEAKKATKKAQIIEKESAKAVQQFNDPEFVAAIDQMRSDGMTPEQIQNEFLTSETYRNAAIPAVADAITPQYQQDLRAAGVQNWEEAGQVLAAREAIDTVNDVQNKASGMGLIIPVGLAALLMILK